MLTRNATRTSQFQQPKSLPSPWLSPVGAHVLFSSPELVGTPMSYGRNEEIYGEGEPADYLYKIVRGAVRIYRVLDDGRRQISAFYLSGDVFGMEGGEEHACSAEAIGDIDVIVFKRSTLVALANRDGEIVRQMWGMTAWELHRAQEHILLLIKSAQERVVSFLLEMSDRVESNEIELPMSRQDIADHLGLTIETISRTFSQLESGALIGIPTSRRVVLRNRAALDRLAA